MYRSNFCEPVTLSIKKIFFKNCNCISVYKSVVRCRKPLTKPISSIVVHDRHYKVQTHKNYCSCNASQRYCQ